MASSPPSSSERSTLSLHEASAGDAEVIGGRGKITMLASIEIEATWIFECSRSQEPLQFRIYQCEAGHFTCKDCFMQFSDQCHLCSLEDEQFRNCFPMEFLMMFLKFSCTNQKYGCDKVNMLYHELNKHAAECLLHPCYCPYSKCQFVGLTESSCNHIRDVHKKSVIKFNYGTQIKVVIPRSCMFKVISEVDCIFLLRKTDESTLSVTSTRVSRSSKPRFLYELKTDGSVGTSGGRYLELRSWIGHTRPDGELTKSNASLVVPPDLCAPNGDIHVFVTIKKAEASNSQS